MECTFLFLVDGDCCADRLAQGAGWDHWLSSLKFLIIGLLEGDWGCFFANDYCADRPAHGAGWDHWRSSLKFLLLGFWRSDGLLNIY